MWPRFQAADRLGLSQIAEEENPAIRLAAVRSLGALGDPEALPTLIELLRSEDGAVREAAQAGIDRIVDGAE